MRGAGSATTGRRRAFGLVGAVVVALAVPVVTALPALAAPTLGLDKDASVTSAQPGQDFTYTLVARCSGLTEACVNATVTDVIPADIDVTTLPQSNSERVVAFDAATRTLTVTFIIPLPAPSPSGATGLTAGSSRNIELGVRIPENSPALDGAVIANTAHLTAQGAAEATATANVTVDVPRVVRPVATKTWTDGSVVAGSGVAGTITLGVRNASSTTAQVSALRVEDSTPATFENFDVTGIGPVVFPAGADRVTVFACTAVGSVCPDSSYAGSGAQPGPTLTLPVPAAQVTALRFVFSNAAGTALPVDPTGGTVQVATALRGTVRSSGAAIAPTSATDISNCAVPAGTDPVAGTVTGATVCASTTIVPAQATMSIGKTFFSDTNGNYAADGQAVDGQNSLVSGLITATNTSPFAVSQLTISDPATSGVSEYSKIDVTRVRVVFPTGANSADVAFDCQGTMIKQDFTAPPTTVDVPVPCTSGRTDSTTVTYTGVDANGNGTIAASAKAVLGVQGRLNDNVAADDLVGGSSAGVQNCASGTATSSIDGVGAAAAAGCASVQVQPAFSRLQGVKTAERPVILPGLPRSFTLSFTNNGTVPATGVTLVDPADPTAAGNPFDVLRLVSLTLPATPTATAEVWDPNTAGYVPYNAADADLLARARGFRVTPVGPLAPGAKFQLTAGTVLRDGVPIGTTVQNCAGIGSDTQESTAFCSPVITATEPSEGASVQKVITPATSVRPQPGLPGQTIQVKLAAQNTGTLWLRRLIVQDTDPDFFDAVDVTGTVRVNFPPFQPAAGRTIQVKVDVCTTGCAGGTFVEGAPTTSSTPPLPTGPDGPIDPADVRGFRITFLTSDDSYTIQPGTSFPASGACSATSVCIDVKPRATLHSDPSTAAPATLTDTAAGSGYETTRQLPGQPAAIPPSTATHTLTAGTAQLRFTKTPDSSVGPGEPIPFTLNLTNTGTGPLPDPVIVDPIPANLDFAPTDPTNPYTLTITQPAGAPTPPAETFAADTDAGGRVTGLNWSFPGLVLLPGGSITVSFTAQLAPGVAAGSTTANRAGGSADRPDLGCAPGAPAPGTATDDPTFGPGLFCTSAAAVRTLAGNAIRTEKWVAGDDSLGWMNSITGDLLPLADPGCPLLVVDGRDYTRYPCVARVAPGRAFDFYLRLTNAGTNPATELRLVDVFPAPGDTGVILTGEQRGTQWEQAPTLLTPVTIDAPGTLDASYTNGTTACTTDLNRPPVACAATDWDAGYSPAATAFRGIITFPGTPGLAPGGTTALRFRMVAPASPADPSENEIAWNSFAHTEFFADSGRSVQLPPTEPIKTGVALVYGDVTVTKHVTGSTEVGPFEFAYQCTVTPENADGTDGSPVDVNHGTFQLAANQSVTLTTLPARASCAVWETDTAGLIGDATGEANAKTIVVPVNGRSAVPTVTITNEPAPPTTTTPTPVTTPTSVPTSPTTGQEPPAQHRNVRRDTDVGRHRPTHDRYDRFDRRQRHRFLDDVNDRTDHTIGERWCGAAESVAQHRLCGRSVRHCRSTAPARRRRPGADRTPTSSR